MRTCVRAASSKRARSASSLPCCVLSCFGYIAGRSKARLEARKVEMSRQTGLCRRRGLGRWRLSPARGRPALKESHCSLTKDGVARGCGRVIEGGDPVTAGGSDLQAFIASRDNCDQKHALVF